MLPDNIHRHFQNPYNRRELSGAAGTGRAGMRECGAEISIYIDFQGEEISEASFEASGSRAIIAAGSVFVRRLEGLDWRKAAAIPPDAIYMSLVENGKDNTERVLLSAPAACDDSNATGSLAQACRFAIEALHRAFEDSLERGNFPEAASTEENSVLVAMSGGVDSSTACLLEHQSGKGVIGVTMRLLREEGGASSCCSSESIDQARQVCHSLGIPHLTVDYTRSFHRLVVENFINEYLEGRTPNPCTTCNGSFRFPALVDLASRLGAGSVATGHYARITETDGDWWLARGKDSGKDQSYMLWGIDRPLLPRLEFPLGNFEKRETRRLARNAGLSVHNRVDSQDVCFIRGDDYRGFIAERASRTGSAPPGEGEIVDTSGNKVGYHRGYLNFTVGQRRGLGISSSEPLYVVRTDPAANVVVVGTREELAVNSLALERIKAFLPRKRLEEVGGLRVQIRYNSPAIDCRLVSHGSGGVEAGARSGTGAWWLELARPAYGVAAGQSGVIYIDDLLVAGGIIARTEA